MSKQDLLVSAGSPEATQIKFKDPARLRDNTMIPAFYANSIESILRQPRLDGLERIKRLIRTARAVDGDVPGLMAFIGRAALMVALSKSA